MDAKQQFEYAKECIEKKKYVECLQYLMLAKRSGHIEANKYYAFLLDTDQKFRDVVEQNYYINITTKGLSSKTAISDLVSEGRLLTWQQKLLDLTFRNKFLNFRET